MDEESRERAIKALRYFFKNEQERLDSYTKEELYNHLYFFIHAYHETIANKPYHIPNYKMIADYFKVPLNEYNES